MTSDTDNSLHHFLKSFGHPSDAHVQPTQVSESEIQLVAATVSEHWTLLANILGITEEEIANFSVSIDPYYRLKFTGFTG